MRYLTTLLATIIAASPAVAAESQYDHDLNQLTEQRNKALEATVDPINRRYQAGLEQLLKRATQANSLEDALKIRAALGAIPASSSALPAPTPKIVSRTLERKLTGTQWVGDGKNYLGTLTFRDHSTVAWTNTTGLAAALAFYQITDNGTVRFQIGQKPQVLTVAPDLTAITVGDSTFTRK